MQKGLTLVELAQQLTDIENKKKDFVVPTTKLQMTDTGKLWFDGAPDLYEPTPLAHRQMAARLKIPQDYYDRMLQEQPDLLATNVNTWFRKNPERRLLRTIDTRARAFLSDRFKPRENFPVANVVLPVLNQTEGVEILSTQLTETRMYMQVISHQLTGTLVKNRTEAHVGDIVDLRGGVTITNSEVGCGAFNLSMFVYVLQCMNGMIREHSIRKTHIGKRIEVDENGDGVGIFSAEAIAADQQAFLLMVRDTMRYAFNKVSFEAEVAKFQATADRRMEPKRIPEIIEDVTKRYSLNKTEGQDILGRLLAGQDFSQWGLASAVTNLANDVQDYDRVVELEKIGGKIIDISPSDWKVMAA